MEIINLTMKDYKRMRKIIKNDHKSYQYTIDIEDREYPYDSKEFWMLKMVKALNIKDYVLDKYHQTLNEIDYHDNTFEDENKRKMILNSSLSLKIFSWEIFYI